MELVYPNKRYYDNHLTNIQSQTCTLMQGISRSFEYEAIQLVMDTCERIHVMIILAMQFKT